MIHEIFAGHDPVVALPDMTQAQKDNELERIFERLTPRVEGHVGRLGGFNCNAQRFKRHIDHEFDRGFAAGTDVTYALFQRLWWDSEKMRQKGWLDGYDKGYSAGREGEANFRAES